VRRRFLRIRMLLVRLGFALGRRLPLQARVVLATSHGERISGNLAWIHAALERRGTPVTVLAYRHAPGRRAQLWAAAHSLLAGYRLARARVFVVDDYFFPMYVIRPRPGTTFVQVWHGCGAFKKFGYSVLDRTFGADEEMVRHVPIHANYDVCLVSSMRVAPHYAEAFRQPLERFTSRFGIPRTDLFFDEAHIARVTADIRRRYGLPEDRRVILYAPTFRGESVIRARFEDHLDLRLLRERLGDDHVVLVRLHPFVRQGLRLEPEEAGFAIDVSDYPDINELMLVSDVLVTDYSSAIYEFSLLGRPIVLYAPDHDAYEHERGFYLDFPADLPGPVFETTDELAAYLRAGRFDLERVAAFREASFDVADGHATDRLVDELLIPALHPGEGFETARG
jgi:teichoic acid ribitol-phosphate primase